MIDLARPGFLWAGALLALGPLLLHLLRPVERFRRTLPTSRFLTADPKRRVRLHRTPDERVLLLLRMLLCLVLGAAFAGIGWVGAESGVATLIVVDGGSAMRDDWAGAHALLTERPGDRDAHVVIVRPAPDAMPGLERLGPGVPSKSLWAELAPEEGDGDVRLAHLVRAVRTSAEKTLGYDSIEALVITDPSWRAWTAGTATLRERIWPGRVGLAAPMTASTNDTVATSDPLRVSLHAPPVLRGPVARALSVLGATVDTTQNGVPTDPAEITLSVGPDPDGWDGLWLPGEGDDAATTLDAFLLLDGRTFPGAGAASGGTPAAGTTVSLLRVGGRPAAAARMTETECRMVLPLDTGAPIARSPELPLLLEGALDAGCGVLPEPPGAEEAFRRLLEGGSRPATVATADIRNTGAGRPLERWILAFALLIAVAETWTSRRIEVKRDGQH